jgi:hypothetical protein
MDRLVDGRAEYDAMLLSTDYAWCWWCARQPEDVPRNWHGPWLIERAHIASMPRVLDRRLIVLLCSRCHRAQHGQVFDRSLQIEQPTLATMLWLKSTFDSEFYKREFIRRFHVGNLPKPKMPPANLQTIYLNRRGTYPGT